MSQENLINNNKQANSRLAVTDEHKQDGGPQLIEQLEFVRNSII